MDSVSRRYGTNIGYSAPHKKSVGSARVFLLVRSLAHEIIITSLCVQVPRDTERPPGRPEFHLGRVVSVEDSRVAMEMYCSCSHSLNTTFFGHHRCESLDCLRFSPSPHRTARGPRGLVLRVASATGNNQGVFFPPPSPPSAPTENCIKNSVELKDLLHAEPEPPQGDWVCSAGLG